MSRPEAPAEPVEPIIPVEADPAVKVPLAIEDWLAVILLATLALITFTNVLVRYFTDQSFAWTEEISVFLLIVLTMAGGSVAFVRNHHIRIEILADNGSPRRQRIMALIANSCVLAFFVLLTVLSVKLVSDEFIYEETSPAIGVPTWWYSVWLPVMAAAISLRTVGILRRIAWRRDRRQMIATILFIVFIVLMLIGVPVGVALGIGGTVAIVLSNLDTPWYGLLTVPQNFYAGLAKYPLLAIPMFVLVGSIFDRSGVAKRLVDFAIAIVGRGPGMLPLVSIAVAMFLGGISGSGPACAAAVGAVMITAMSRAGYPGSFSASIVAAGAATDILIPPSVAFIIYSVLVPGASVPALFAAGMIPGILAGLALIVPAVWLSRKYKMGALESHLPRPPFWASLREASWGLAAPVLILGGMRMGWFTPTEAAVVAVFYGLFVGGFIHRTIKFRDLYTILREAAELSAVIMLVVTLAGIFAWALSTLSVIDPITHAIVNSGLGEWGVLSLLILLLMTVGMFLDGISIFLIFVPLLMPIANAYGWDPVWFGVILTLKVALGQFTPPLAVNLMVSCRIARVPMESTVRWVVWLLGAMFLVLVAVLVFPQLALWLPHKLGY